MLEVDVKSLIEKGIQIDVFLILQLITDNEYDLASKYIAMCNIEDRKRLYIKLNESQYCTNHNDLNELDPNKIIVSPNFSKFQLSGDFFDELVQVFPASVVRPDGNRDYLRTDLKRTKQLYTKTTKNKLAIHQHIIECLRFEILNKTKTGSMGYFKKLPKWIASEEWKVYEQAIKDSTFDSITNLGYGTELE